VHPDQNDIVRFLAGVLPEERAEAMVAHLDTCEPCLERLQALQQLRDDFEGSWEAFVLEWHHRQKAALRSGTHPAALLRVRSVLDGARKLAGLASEALVAGGEPRGWTATLRPAYGGVGDPGDPILALQREASVLLDQDAGAEALEVLQRVATSRPDAAATSLAEISVDGAVVGRLVIDAGRRCVSVLLQNDFLDRHAVRASARILVRPAEHDAQPDTSLEQPLLPVAGATYHLAEFEQLADGVIEVTLALHATSHGSIDDR
jgi:hypothetical protein